MITFEYPLNERIRTLLRLEDLFGRIAHTLRGESPIDHHVTLTSIFEMLEVASRSEFKVDLLQELERQRQTLLAFRDNPDISEEALSGALYEIEQATAGLLSVSGKIGHYLRENDWLMGIRSRAAIPGGACQFDLPAYYHWQNRDVEVRRRDLEGWIRPMLPIRDGLAIVLRLLRASGRPEMQTANRGNYQLTMGGRPIQMVRVRVHLNAQAVPEISANKYVLNVRFMRPDTISRPRQCENDVEFELTLCNL
ncbi:MAG TPA: cell division protein ZapD [Denitromonas sp.]|uniref:cell division protein ZapD n=1 Tax=Denitromonas sp. TaxID=2734609 RepID=UPI001D290A18|nr:cell division protein ZapD [Rhodocyclaceae bacterium]MCP5222811.1 cell division protein ZapD [Zoogloeaceae bacterium]HPR05646.1 cell division protein ZapD [Denitromonas sp.]HQU88986.1 cell division protein ZapD [Denitromonas sp.]HQV15159.1 cell division protein ZapD [Denitromonas sp.]